MYPGEASGVILDSSVPPDGTFADYDANRDEVGLRFLEECADETECSARFATTPSSALNELFDLVDAGQLLTTGVTRHGTPNSEVHDGVDTRRRG